MALIGNDTACSVLVNFKILTHGEKGEEETGESRMRPGTGYRVMRRSPQAPAEAPADTQDSEMKKANGERLAFMNWWRVVETNNRSQGIHVRVRHDRFAL
jgi:hypothetical protein